MAFRPNTNPGPNPDPLRYTLVQTREGSYYLKRGTLSPARINETFRRNAKGMQQANRAAQKIINALREHLQGLHRGRLLARFTGMLLKSMNRQATTNPLAPPCMDYTLFKNFDLQKPYHPFRSLCECSARVWISGNSIHLSIDMGRDSVRKLNELVTDYYFESILLSGDPSRPEPLQAESTASELYPIKGKPYVLEVEPRFTTITLSHPLPEDGRPWMLLWKLSCLEGNELASSPRHYAMMVVEVG